VVIFALPFVGGGPALGRPVAARAA
jgi:hypothetical protein